MYSLIWKKKKKSFFPLYTLQFSAKKENKHRAGGPHFSNECFQAESDWFTREYHDHLSPLGLKITPFFCFLFNFSVVVTKPPFVQIVDELKKKKTNNPRGIVVSYLSLISICSRTRRGLFWESLSVRCVAFLFCFPSLLKKKFLRDRRMNKRSVFFCFWPNVVVDCSNQRRRTHWAAESCFSIFLIPPKRRRMRWSKGVGLTIALLSLVSHNTHWMMYRGEWKCRLQIYKL